MKRKTPRAIGAGIGVLVLLAYLFLTGPGFLLVGLLIAGSERTISERATSPDGRYDARIQSDAAGAVSSPSRLVFVKYRWNPSDEPLLSCRAFSGRGDAPVHLQWLDSGTLLIRHSFPATDVQIAADHCGPIRVIVEDSPHQSV
jgi:hypothetical protein